METRRRSLAKALSWRFLALLITTCLGYLFSRSVSFALWLGLADSAIKIVVYYAHERAWLSIKFGRVPPPEYEI